MPPEPLHVITGELTGDAALDTATSRAILRLVDESRLPATLQVGTPHRVVAFGKHDALSPGFDAAVDIARSFGYDVTVRIAGGRAVVFHPATVRFAWTVPVAEPAATMHARFETLSTAVVDTLAAFGVSSAVGELSGEYCAGAYSVHLTGGGKVMGVGQRLARHAAQVGGMIVVDDPASINTVLEPIYNELGLPLDPAMTGAVSDVKRVSPADVGERLAQELAGDTGATSVSLDTSIRSLAMSFRSDHVPQHLRERVEPS